MYELKSNRMTVGRIILVITLNLGFFSANAWDIAVAVGDHIQFLDVNGSVLGNVSDGMQEVSGLGYNAELRRLYFADNERLHGSVFELTLPKVLGEEQEEGRAHAIVAKQNDDVKGIAYDAMTGVLYWTTGKGHMIRWLRVGEGDGNASSGQALTLLGGMKDQIPMGLAIDSCKRFLYWTNCDPKKPSIERARLDGSHRQALITEQLVEPNAIVVDQATDKIYWVDVWLGVQFEIESADMDGNNRKILYKGTDHQPFALAISSQYVFWADHTHTTLWRLPLNSSDNFPRLQEVMKYHRTPQALVSSQSGEWRSGHCNAIIEPMTTEIPAVRVPITLSPTAAADQSLVSDNTSLRCLHSGTFLPGLNRCSCSVGYSGALCETYDCLNYCVQGTCSGDRVCRCDHGFTGQRCQTDVCHNYCVTGTCSVDDSGNPHCECEEGRHGKHCELSPSSSSNSKSTCLHGGTYLATLNTCVCALGYGGDYCEEDHCHNYCVTGSCSIDTSGKPQCHCREGFSGQRCEVNFTQQEEMKDSLRQVCKDLCSLLEHNSAAIQHFDVCSCSGLEVVTPLDTQWSHSSALISLLALCCLLLVIVALLTQRVLVLRRRPRIKKRIIVNKSVTPLTCRPGPAGEQCEITIENCCNMNICETPCYEPEFRQPEAALSRANHRGGKEEKKTLLGNMELPPDDLY